MQHRPLALRVPFGLYYGWVIVGVSLLTNIASSPLNPLIFSIFVAPISDDTGWSRSAIAWALTFRLVAGGVTMPFLGALIDRLGARWIAVVGGLVVCLSLVGLAVVPALWMFYALFAVSGAVGLGGPGGSILTQVPAAKWFVAQRGRALAIASIGMPAGTVIAIPIAGLLIEAVGWRGAWALFGIGIALLVVPINALFMRRAPEDMGLLPDGAAPEAHAGTSHPIAAITEHDWTVRQALRAPALWLALTALAVIGVALTGTLVYRAAFFEDSGMSPGTVALGIAVDPFTVVFSALAWGAVGDRIPTRYLGVAVGVGMSLSMVPMLLPGGQTWTLFAHSLIWGSSAGAFVTINNLLWPNYFGRAFLGTIRGVVQPVSILASALGAPIYGYLLDGGMAPRSLWVVSIVLFSTAGLLLFLARPPGAPPGPARPAEGALQHVST